MTRRFFNIDSAAQWPTEGKIVIEDLKVKYSPNSDFALKNVNVSIPAGAKVRNRVVRPVVALFAFGVAIGIANTPCSDCILNNEIEPHS